MFCTKFNVINNIKLSKFHNICRKLYQCLNILTTKNLKREDSRKIIMNYRLKTTDEFEEQFKKLTRKNKALAEMFAKAILKLKENPYAGKPLTHDLKGYRSLPIAGKWRIIYEIDENQKLIVLRSIGHRKRIYTEFP